MKTKLEELAGALLVVAQREEEGLTSDELLAVLTAADLVPRVELTFRVRAGFEHKLKKYRKWEELGVMGSEDYGNSADCLQAILDSAERE